MRRRRSARHAPGRRCVVSSVNGSPAAARNCTATPAWAAPCSVWLSSCSVKLRPAALTATAPPGARFVALTSVGSGKSCAPPATGAAAGDSGRRPGPRQLYRAAGLSRCSTSRPHAPRTGRSSVRAAPSCAGLLELGIGVWHNDPGARRTPTGCGPAASTRRGPSPAQWRTANRITFGSPCTRPGLSDPTR